MKGKLIVIEGLDGSGKATQAKRLAAVLEQQGRRVREISFPNYESDSSALVKMYLSGAFGREPGDVNAYAASSFYAVDRYAGMKQDWGPFYEAGGILIADRYTTSNAVHQCCKLPREKWDEYQMAADEMIQKTSTEFAPWNIVPSNDKLFARIYILNALNNIIKKHLKKLEDK